MHVDHECANQLYIKKCHVQNPVDDTISEKFVGESNDVIFLISISDHLLLDISSCSLKWVHNVYVKKILGSQKLQKLITLHNFKIKQFK